MHTFQSIKYIIDIYNTVHGWYYLHNKRKTAEMNVIRRLLFDLKLYNNDYCVSGDFNSFPLSTLVLNLVYKMSHDTISRFWLSDITELIMMSLI